ncbi:MAG: sulfotransferase family protein, partial [Myxococcota bacterium]
MQFLTPRELRSYDLEAALRAVDAQLELELELAPGAGAESEAEADRSSPIFVLSAGWRSGSTLVQRLLCSDPSMLMWGEPFGEAIPVPRMASMLEAFVAKAANRAEDAYESLAADTPLSEQWIANLNPGFAALRRAHRAFFETLLAAPAREKGFERWGAKWVRLTAHHARYLQWLYPRARIVLLVRDPVASYRSYRGKRWYAVNPVARVDNVFKFVAHWKYVTDSFLEAGAGLDALLLRYEDLIGDPKQVERLAQYCELDVDSSVLSVEIRGLRKKRKQLSSWQ